MVPIQVEHEERKEHVRGFKREIGGKLEGETREGICI